MNWTDQKLFAEQEEAATVPFPPDAASPTRHGSFVVGDVWLSVVSEVPRGQAGKHGYPNATAIETGWPAWSSRFGWSMDITAKGWRVPA
jgi:hypothetical protein